MSPCRADPPADASAAAAALAPSEPPAPESSVSEAVPTSAASLPLAAGAADDDWDDAAAAAARARAAFPDDGAHAWTAVERVMRGYVKQVGPVCAAAAVAGAWNSAFGFALLDDHAAKPNDGTALCARDVLDLYEAQASGELGRAKLYRNKANTVAKVSTWSIGNPALVRALKNCHSKVRNGATDLRLSVRVLVDARLLKRPGGVDESWACVVRALSQERVVLLMHTKNHYCLISAHREYMDTAAGEHVREIRLAPKGQVPITPMRWQAACAIMRGSKAYKIFRVEGYSETNPAMALSDDAFGGGESENDDVPVVWMGRGAQGSGASGEAEAGAGSDDE